MGQGKRNYAQNVGALVHVFCLDWFLSSTSNLGFVAIKFYKLKFGFYLKINSKGMGPIKRSNAILRHIQWFFKVWCHQTHKLKIVLEVHLHTTTILVVVGRSLIALVLFS